MINTKPWAYTVKIKAIFNKIAATDLGVYIQSFEGCILFDCIYSGYNYNNNIENGLIFIAGEMLTPKLLQKRVRVC